MLASIEKAGALTGELRRAVEGANTLTELEDLYRPYRPKRRTRASMAKERGLAPLADTLRSGKRPDGRPGGPALEEARAYCCLLYTSSPLSVRNPGLTPRKPHSRALPSRTAFV